MNTSIGPISAEINTVVSIRLKKDNNFERTLASSSYINARQDYSRGSIITVSATVNLKEGNTVDVI
jgi:hypothetical protein